MPQESDIPATKSESLFLLVGSLHGSIAGMRLLRDRFVPIYRHFVPPNPLITVGRMLRLVPQPDYARYENELKGLRDAAWATIEQSNSWGKELVALGLGPVVNELARASVVHISFDGNVIVLFYEWVKAMRGYDREGAKVFPAVMQNARSAQTHLSTFVAANEAFRRLIEGSAPEA